MKHKAVVIGVNYYTGLSTVRALGRQGVPVVACEYDRKAYGLRSRYINEVLVIPDVKIAPKQAIHILIEYGKKQAQKPVLLPTHDNYVALVDDYLPELLPYYLIPQTKQGLYHEVMYKNSLAELAKQHGVKVPAFCPIDKLNIDEVDDTIGFPCIIKPDNSSAFVKQFAKKVLICDDRVALEKALSTMQNAGLDGKVEQIIQGFDDHMVTYDAYVAQSGEVTHDVTMQKLRQYPINFGASVYIHQINIPKIREIGRPFLETIGWRGFAEIEFKRQANTDDYYLIEINTRMTNFNALLERLGLNMAYLTYLDLTGEEIGERHITEDTDMAFRYFFDDLAAIRAYRKAGQLSKADIKANAGKKTVGALVAKDDMKPALYYLYQKIHNRLKR